MRIAYLCADLGVPVLGHKGASVHVREFTDALVEIGHQVHVFAAAGMKGDTLTLAPSMLAALTVLAPSPETDALAQRMASSVLRVGLPRDAARVRSEIRHLLADPEFAARALPALREFQPELLIARHSLFSVAGAELARALGLPHVLEVNAPLSEERRRYWELSLAELAERAERSAFAAADVLLAVSEAIRSYVVRQGADPGRVAVMPNGVDPRRFHPEVDPSPVRERYQLQGKLVVGFVGSLKPWHGVAMLLDAFDGVRTILADPNHRAGDSARTLDALHLLVVGDGPERAALEQRAHALGLGGQVTFTGLVSHDEVPHYVAAIDIAVAPYLAVDGFYFSPLKVMEYLAAGRPVVAPMLGQIPSLLRGPGAPRGLLYPPDDRRALGMALLQLARDPALRQTLGANGAASARLGGSWQSVARAVVDRARVMHAVAGAV